MKKPYSKIKKYLKLLFSNKIEDNENENNLLEGLRKISDKEKLYILNDSIGSLRDVYISRLAKIDSRLAFIITFVSLALSGSIALYTYMAGLYIIKYFCIFFIYILYQIFILTYIIFLYYPRNNYPIPNPLHLIINSRI